MSGCGLRPATQRSNFQPPKGFSFRSANLNINFPLTTRLRYKQAWHRRGFEKQISFPLDFKLAKSQKMLARVWLSFSKSWFLPRGLWQMWLMSLPQISKTVSPLISFPCRAHISTLRERERERSQGHSHSVVRASWIWWLIRVFWLGLLTNKALLCSAHRFKAEASLTACLCCCFPRRARIRARTHAHTVLYLPTHSPSWNSPKTPATLHIKKDLTVALPDGDD